MTIQRRERILLIAAIAVVALVAARPILRSVFGGGGSQIDELRTAIIEKEEELEGSRKLVRQWRSIHEQSMADDPEAAKGLLMSRVNVLLLQAGLADKQVTPQAGSPVKTGSDASYYPVALSLTCKGTLEQIVKFFDMLDQEPYLVKVTSFTLNPQEKSEIISLNPCRIEALIPARPVLRRAQSGAERKVPDPLPAPQVRNAYAQLTAKNIFGPPRPTPTPMPAPVAPVEPVEPRPAVGQRPSVRRGPGTLVGTVIHGPTTGVYVRNHNETPWYNLGESIGSRQPHTLVFVHPLGAVVRDQRGQHFYIEIGQSVDQPKALTRENLAADELLELYDAWQSASH